jgi:hypothetical protein
VEREFKDWRAFCEYYKEWLGRTEMEMPTHPWKQFLTARDVELRDEVPGVNEILNHTDST